MPAERYWYALGGGVIASNIALPELHQREAVDAEWTLHCSDDAPATTTTAAPFHTWRRPHGRIDAEFIRDHDRVVLRFPRLADFVLCERTRHIACRLRARATPAQVRPTFYNQVVPLVYSQHRLVLHAGAVGTSRGAVGFVGGTGLGKSTLVAAFARRGHAFVTDDVLLLDTSGPRVAAIPSRLPLRLWMDSARAVVARAATLPRVRQHIEKRLVTADALGATEADRPLPLVRVYLLVRTVDTRPRIASPAPASAAVTLLRSSFQLDVDNPQVWERTLRDVGKLVSCVSCRKLLVPADLNRLNEVLDLVTADLASIDHDGNSAG